MAHEIFRNRSPRQSRAIPVPGRDMQGQTLSGIIIFVRLRHRPTDVVLLSPPTVLLTCTSDSTGEESVALTRRRAHSSLFPLSHRTDGDEHDSCI